VALRGISRLDKIRFVRLRYCFWRGLAIIEMADIIGISESNIGVKINRIKKHLTLKSKIINHGVLKKMKKIWDTQNNEALYAIMSVALHNRVLSKKERAGHVANISELLFDYREWLRWNFYDYARMDQVG